MRRRTPPGEEFHCSQEIASIWTSRVQYLQEERALIAGAKRVREERREAERAAKLAEEESRAAAQEARLALQRAEEARLREQEASRRTVGKNGQNSVDSTILDGSWSIFFLNLCIAFYFKENLRQTRKKRI